MELLLLLAKTTTGNATLIIGKTLLRLLQDGVIQ